MKGRHVVLGLALLVAAGLAAFGDKEPEGAVVESVERVERPSPAPTVVPAQPAAARAEGGTEVMRLIPRDQLIGQDGDGNGSVFGTHSWNPPPPAPPPSAEAPPPSAPPIPFTFIGKALGDGRWEVYVAQGEHVQSVRAGDTVAGAWRIDAVAPPVMTLTYLPLGQQQQMNIGANE